VSKITPTTGTEGPLAQGVQKLNLQYGRSVSGVNPSTNISLGADYKFNITVNGDGPHLVSILGYQVLKDPKAIALALATAINGVEATDPTLNLAFRQFTCDWLTDHYELRSGLYGDNSSVVVTDAGSENIAVALKIGTANGGTEGSFYPKQSAVASLVQIVENPNPTRVTLVGIDEVNLDGAQLDVDLTHLDNSPNAGDVADSVRIGDGVTELSLATDGSIKTIQLFKKPYDSITASYPTSTQEVYSSRVGGIAGTIQETVTINYTDSTKNFLLDLSRT